MHTHNKENAPAARPGHRQGSAGHGNTLRANGSPGAAAAQGQRPNAFKWWEDNAAPPDVPEPLLFSFAFARGGKTDTQWRAVVMRWDLWSDFIAAEPHVIAADADKGKQPYMVAAEIVPGSTRTNANVVRRTAVTLDLERPKHRDDLPPLPPIAEMRKRLAALGYMALIYSTPSATEMLPRYRVIVPAVPFEPAKTKLASRELAERLDVIDYYDHASHVISQPMYWPLRRRGGWYAYTTTDGALYDASYLPDEEPPVQQHVQRVAPMPDDEQDDMLAAACPLIEPCLVEGQRHYLMLRVTGGLRKAGILYAAAETFARDVAPGLYTDAGGHWNGVATTYAQTDVKALVGFPGLLDESFGVPRHVVKALLRLLPDRTMGEGHTGYERRPIVLDALPQPVAPVRYLVDGWLVQGPYVGILSGRPHVGKSTLMTLLAACVATGRDFCGLPVQQAPVYYVAEENAKELNDRLIALAALWASGKSMPQYAQELFAGRLFRVSGIGRLNEARLAELIAVLDQNPAQPPGLIVVDTVRRVIAGDENSAEDVGRLVDLLEHLAHRYQCPVIGLAHPPKAGTSAISGSGIYEATTRWVALLERRDDDTIALRLIKIDAPPPKAPLIFAIRQADLAFMLDAPLGAHEQATAGIAEHLPDADRDTARSDARMTDVKLLRYLQQHPRKSQEDVANRFNVSRQSISKRLGKLVELGMLVDSHRPFKLTANGEQHLRAAADDLDPLE